MRQSDFSINIGQNMCIRQPLKTWTVETGFVTLGLICVDFYTQYNGEIRF